MSTLTGRALVTSLTALVGAVAAILPATPALAATWSVVATPNASVNDNILIGADVAVPPPRSTSRFPTAHTLAGALPSTPLS